MGKIVNYATGLILLGMATTAVTGAGCSSSRHSTGIEAKVTEKTQPQVEIKNNVLYRKTFGAPVEFTYNKATSRNINKILELRKLMNPKQWGNLTEAETKILFWCLDLYDQKLDGHIEEESSKAVLEATGRMLYEKFGPTYTGKTQIPEKVEPKDISEIVE